MKRLNKSMWPLLLIAFLIASAVLFKDQKIAADTNFSTKDNKPLAAENSNSSVTPNNNSAVSNQNSSTDNRQLTTDNLSLPILMYHHIRDFNNPSDKIGTNLSVSPIDFAKELDLIKERGYQTITFHDIASGNVPEKSIILTFDDGYENFYQNAFPELKKRGMKAVSFIIINNVTRGDYLTRNQILEMGQNGIEIGSHTLSHPNLATATESKIETELINSKKYLEDLIGKKIISFCYPSGKYTEATKTLVKNTGYNFAVTTNGGITTFNDLFALNRYRVNNGTSITKWIK